MLRSRVQVSPSPPFIKTLTDLIKSMKIFQIIKSVLSAFCGIQSNNNFHKDDKFIENNGVKYFLIIGFILVIILGASLFYLVGFILE